MSDSPDPSRLQTRWSDEEYASLSWHDNHIHGWRIRRGEHGEGDLVLDIDHILEWLRQPGSARCKFRIAPATLTFHHASELAIAIDWQGTPLVPVSISTVRREPHICAKGLQSFRWTIELSWPPGRIELVAEGFTQVLRAEPIVVDEQCLTPAQREASPR